MRIEPTRGRRCLAALLIIALGAACGPRGPSPSPSSDTLVVATPADVVTLDPQNSNDIQSDQMILMLYGRLLRFDERLRVTGDLAESWSVTPDGRTWTFRLRPDLRFDTGAPLDATTVKASFARILDTELKNVYRPLFDMIARIDVIDPRTVRFVTAYPFRAFERTLAHMAASIVDPKLAQTFGRRLGRSVESVSGSGPYRLVRWIRDQEIVVERNPHYWGPRPPTARVIYRVIPEAASRRAALEAGDVAVVTALAPTDIRPIAADPFLKIHSVPSVGTRALIFNCAREPFRDRRVRQAVSYAIDRRAIAEGMFAGHSTISTGATSPLVRGYADLGEIAYDPARAKSLLAAAGLPNGFKTSLWTSTNIPFGAELAEALAAQLKLVGIQASLEVVDWVTWVSKYRGQRPGESPLELFLGGFGGSTADADWSLRPRFMTQPTNATNWGFYSNAEFDDVIVRAMKENDASRQLGLYRRAQEIIYLEDPAAAWLYGFDFVVAARRNVVNLTLSPVGVVTFERAVQLAN